MDAPSPRPGRVSYAEAIRHGFRYLLANYPEVFAIGQGLWSPWYVGNSMTDLDAEFGKDRVIDTPVSELACTGAAIGASLCGYRPIIVHPRMDFMLLATDAIVNQAAKWTHMLGGAKSPAVTIRAIINRGGEQGAQHSQALHAWYAHIPGLRLVMPATPADARDLLVSAVLSDDPVIYIDNRWLYDVEGPVGDVTERSLAEEGPRVLRTGDDVTLVGSGYATEICLRAADRLEEADISAEVVDLRVLNPYDPSVVARSVAHTGRLVAVDDGWRVCGMAGEVIASTVEALEPSALHAKPARITLPPAPAPTSRALERIYYPTEEAVAARVRVMVESGRLPETAPAA